MGAAIPDWVVLDCKAPLRRGDTVGTYSAVDASSFSLRSASYLTDRVKAASGREAFRLVGVNVFLSNAPIANVAEAVPHLRDYITEHHHSTEYFFVMVFVLPGKPVHTVVYLFARALPIGVDPAFDTALRRFVAGDADYRNKRLKLLARLEKAPWIISASANRLGIDRPAILGTKLTMTHYTGRGYFEASVDVGSSMVASAIHGIILRGCASIVVVTGFTIEGQTEEELPERMLGSVRFNQIDVPGVISDMRATY